jgi:hypothetical protein
MHRLCEAQIPLGSAEVIISGSSRITAPVSIAPWRAGGAHRHQRYQPDGRYGRRALDGLARSRRARLDRGIPPARSGSAQAQVSLFRLSAE